jgi:hypothetical protein
VQLEGSGKKVKSKNKKTKKLRKKKKVKLFPWQAVKAYRVVRC